MIKRIVIVLGVVLVVASGLTIALGSAAGAGGPTTINAEIGQGSKNVDVGDATIVRTLNNDGTESLTIDLTVPAGDILQVHVCVSTSPFTAKVPPGQCAYGFENLTGTTFHTVIELGQTYVGQTIYLQLDVNNGGLTAYACWQNGSPFFGSCEVPSTDTPVPVGTIGAIGLAGGLGVVFAGTQLSRRRRTAVPHGASTS